jgi:hypothetical protein
MEIFVPNYTNFDEISMIHDLHHKENIVQNKLTKQLSIVSYIMQCNCKRLIGHDVTSELAATKKQYYTI